MDNEYNEYNDYDDNNEVFCLPPETFVMKAAQCSFCDNPRMSEHSITFNYGWRNCGNKYCKDSLDLSMRDYFKRRKCISRYILLNKLYPEFDPNTKYRITRSSGEIDGDWMLGCNFERCISYFDTYKCWVIYLRKGESYKPVSIKEFGDLNESIDSDDFIKRINQYLEIKN